MRNVIREEYVFLVVLYELNLVIYLFVIRNIKLGHLGNWDYFSIRVLIVFSSSTWVCLGVL